MRTRSSRFFVILLHLLGVSNHHLPSWYYDLTQSQANNDRASFYSGIRGVHPHSIVLERLNLEEVGGLDGVDWLPQISTISSSSQSSVTIREPFWLQDTKDGKCLGPSGGFSECGDATLWFILRRSTQRKSLKMGPFGVEETLGKVDLEEPYRYALQVVDYDYDYSDGPDKQEMQQNNDENAILFPFLPPWRRRRQQQNDCLMPSTLTTSLWSRLTQQEQENSDKSSSLISPHAVELGSCQSQKAAWSWRVDEQGVLYLPEDATKDRRCLQRTTTSSAVLSNCQNHTHDMEQPQHQRLVQFSLVRYHATTTPTLSSKETQQQQQQQRQSYARPTTSQEHQRQQQQRREVEKQPDRNGGLPSSKDIAHSHASGPVKPRVHAPLLEMNLAARPLLSNLPTRAERKASPNTPFAALQDSNPILFLGQGSSRKNTDNSRKQKGKAPASVANLSPPPPSSPGKLRKIEVHPYIETSKNEIWVDPQTGLEYPTDLCRYLGHEQKESGRHTIMGVGQFLKTMLKIKVYGIALYVSKRDVLADPSFQQFAGLTTDELRQRPDFYEKLRTMPPSTADPSDGGFFDRTLFLKTNMQLSTETMRSSLDSDWKMLSDEHKAMLIDSSLRPRPANEHMLQVIQRADNPSRCSCAQVAPDEYQADPSCCPRGIELAFTWRKNGNLEIRMNGQLLDIFPRPDIAAGIFFEYFRTDDPFSMDFIERTVDGFPFLLAPLAQVQGITSHVLQQHQTKAQEHAGGNSVFKALSGAADVVSSHAAGMVGAVQHGAAETAANAAHAVQSAGDALRHLGEEMDRRKEHMWKQIVSIPHSPPNPAALFSEFVSKVKGEKNDELEVNGKEADTIIDHDGVEGTPRRAPHGRVFRPTTSKWFGETLEVPDEIAPIIHPTMNKTILSLVHLYLLLILIVSFPATNYNRTRFVVRRSCKTISVSSSEASLLRFGPEKGMVDGPSFPKEKALSSYREYHNGRGDHCITPNFASEPLEALDQRPPDDKHREQEEARQPVRIDLTSRDRMECKERRSSGKGAKRFYSRARRVMKQSMRSQSTGCPSSSISSVSDSSVGPEEGDHLSAGGNRSNNGCQREASNDKMKKSLSYFL